MKLKYIISKISAFYILCAIWPVDIAAKAKEQPQDLTFHIDVRDNLTRRPLNKIEVIIEVENDTSNYTLRTETVEGIATFSNVPAGASKYIFTLSSNTIPSKVTSNKVISIGRKTSNDKTPQLQNVRDYELERIEYSVSDKMQKTHNIGPIYLKPKRSKILDEISVTASKVMFYYKGDTLVYNADAFILAEGTMLDGLISQLPGVTINRRGEIKVNGRDISALILNGNDLFNGNNQLMLENLAAYTVKDIKVYNKAGFNSVALRVNAGDTKYVMDVRLKRQYLHGFLGNFEAGYGSRSRYRAKLFGMWYSENAGMTVFLSSNNLNDDTKPKPGYSDGSWSDLNPSAGKGLYHSGGITYNAEGPDSKWKVQGDAVAKCSDGTVTRTQNSTILIPQNEMYRYSFDDTRNKNFSINSFHDFKLSLARRMVFALSPKVEYSRYRQEGSDISASYNQELEEVSRQIIENIYFGQPAFSQHMLNRSLVKSLERRSRFALAVDANSLIRLRPNDGRAMLTIGGTVNVDNQRPGYYTYRQFDFTSRPEDNSSLLQHNDASPYRDHIYKGYARYAQSFSVLNLHLNVDYDFTRREQTRTSQFYQGEVMLDYLTPSILPQFCINLPIDLNESYLSRQWENQNLLKPSVNMRWELSSKADLGMMLDIPLIVSQRTLDYHRGKKDQYITSTRFLSEVNASLVFQSKLPGRNYILSAGFKSSVSQPNLLNMIDVIDDTDPLNVVMGNPSLENARINTITFGLMVQGKSPHHNVSMSYTSLKDAISQGYYYLSNTGQRISRPYNVDGNFQSNVSYAISWWTMDKIILSNKISGGYMCSRELIGAIANSDFDVTMAPPVNQVNNLSVSDRFDVSFNFSGKYNLKAFADLDLRTYRSTNSTFADDLTFNGSYGVSTVLNLPYNWGLSTDLTFYTRRGYFDSQLNTTDILWNARVSRSFLKGSLVCAIDCYDLLRQLSNVSYTVNAQYRTETVTNVIPSYFLFSIQYRFNKQPKRN